MSNINVNTFKGILTLCYEQLEKLSLRNKNKVNTGFIIFYYNALKKTFYTIIVEPELLFITVQLLRCSNICIYFFSKRISFIKSFKI